NPTQAEALGMTDLNGGALFNAEFGIRHRGSTVPERSGVALSFCRRPGLIFIIYTIAAADRANLGVAMPFIRKEFDMSNAEAGGLMSLFLLAYALAQIPAGFAFARIGVSKILPGAMILTSILTGLVGTAGSLLMLKIYRFGLGLAEGPLPISMTSTINN